MGQHQKAVQLRAVLNRVRPGTKREQEHRDRQIALKENDRQHPHYDVLTQRQTHSDAPPGNCSKGSSGC
jgi:hypothetical protein